jgi:hypothetical protein
MAPRKYFIEWPHTGDLDDHVVWYDATGPGIEVITPDLRPVGGDLNDPVRAVWAGSLYASPIIGFARRAPSYRHREEPSLDVVNFYPAIPTDGSERLSQEACGKKREFVVVYIDDAHGKGIAVTRKTLKRAWKR